MTSLADQEASTPEPAPQEEFNKEMIDLAAGGSEINVASELQVIIARVDAEISKCDEKIKELQRFESLRKQLSSKREFLSTALGSIESSRE
jgi:predicted ATPase